MAYVASRWQENLLLVFDKCSTTTSIFTLLWTIQELEMLQSKVQARVWQSHLTPSLFKRKKEEGKKEGRKEEGRKESHFHWRWRKWVWMNQRGCWWPGRYSWAGSQTDEKDELAEMFSSPSKEQKVLKKRRRPGCEEAEVLQLQQHQQLSGQGWALDAQGQQTTQNNFTRC